MRYLALLLLSLAAGAADDLAMNVVLPGDAKQILTTEQDAEAKAKATYDAAVTKLRTDAVVKLQKAQEAATKHGDLDGAMAIKARIVDLNGGKDVAAKPNPMEAFVGRWVGTWDRGTTGSNIAHEAWEIAADGTCVSGPMQGKWKIRPDGAYEVHWDQGMVDIIKEIGPGGRISAARSNGKIVSLQKQ